jgi:hypothetical protein
MNPIVFAYVLNILILIPVALITLLGGQAGNRRVFQNKFTESEGTRTILGSLWTAILIGSCLGLFYPVQMSPILILQVIYKSVWLLVFVVPRLVTGRGREVPWGVAITFLVVVVSYPWIIPWMLLFGSP